ncbi:degT/DnrJ/EryC1/StrS aminotransferase [Streptomyces sp. NBC_01803]|uniref:degT/DnrJ/EryC1/StrS aminotransferase n=1 Tax=Streptomyces sp. NBC_01803 TaxID=2975946 RepID=UPI002DDB0A13|nr:degT/DnrJ/EryC1/StrS aminotransferase [Streptomyces sp. NBC_01803]WSA43127.1 degT/DnrJ/EryC1/StrS aminotransferase [Streptomyces sp. NBC_01803]
MASFDTALVLARVMTTGVVMSIEKSDRELPGLERLLTKRTGRRKAVLVNSRTAAVHAALVGLGAGHGDEITHPGLDAPTRAFVAWLGVSVRTDGPAAFDQLALTPDNAGRLAALAARSTAPALVVDLTGLGFGPAAAVLTDDERAWARAERLKIFGAHDLRTMWTQEEADPELVPGVQFNYRLSPLVAACARMALTRADEAPAPTGATR